MQNSFDSSSWTAAAAIERVEEVPVLVKEAAKAVVDERLLDYLGRICERARSGGVCVLISRDGVLSTASIDRRGIAGDEASVFNEHSPVQMSCLTKSLTATLLAAAVAERAMSLDDEVAGVFRGVCTGYERLAGIRLHQLLSHTHGLDASAVLAAPKRSDGFMDLSGLIADLAAAPRISSPQQNLFSYGPAGAWLIGGWLEHRRGQCYGDIVHRVLGRPGPASEAELVCPATGGTLRVSALEMMAVVQHHIVAPSMAELRAPLVPFPGWSVGRRAVARGWYDYWNGWFGHNSQTPGDAMVVRFHPSKRIAVVITSAAPRLPMYVLRCLFNKVLPEFTDRLALSTAEQSGGAFDAEMARHCGIYENAAVSIAIAAEETCLQLTMKSRLASSATLSTERSAALSPLRPVGWHDVFRATPAAWPLTGFVQFVGADVRERRLWDGRVLYRHATTKASASVMRH